VRLSGAVEQGAQPVQGLERFARRQAVGVDQGEFAFAPASS
jgi:hypothetical protein